MLQPRWVTSIWYSCAEQLLAPATPDVPRAVQLLGGVVDGACCLALLFLAVSSLVAARRARAAVQPGG